MVPDLSRFMAFSPKDQWTHRWLRFGRGRLLHRALEASAFLLISRPFRATSVCGLSHDSAIVPGYCSRLHSPRCVKCCKALGIKAGNGNPYNEGVDV